MSYTPGKTSQKIISGCRQTFSQLITFYSDYSVGQSVSQSIRKAGSLSVSQAGRQSVIQSVRQAVSQLVRQADRQPVSQPGSLFILTILSVSQTVS